MKNKKIAIIGTAGLPANCGEFEMLAEHLLKRLGGKWDISVYCSSKKYTKAQRLKTYKGARLIYLPLEANGIQSILYDSLSILHALFFADVLLVLGVGGGFVLPFARLFTRKTIVTAIDSIEWKRNKWSKIARLYFWIAEWMAIKFSNAHIADNESIQNYLAIRYKTISTLIEYGADHMPTISPIRSADKEKYPFLKGPYAFKVCRIEPENNISMVLSAFSKLPKHPLVMVGNWSNSEYGIKTRKEFSKFPNIILLDPIYDQKVLDVLRGNCYVYIHGHSAGGTNPSLVEAMYLGLPIMAYGVSYNKTTTEGKAFYFKSADELVDLIKTKKLSDLKEAAAVMKDIAHSRYTWKLVADKYEYMIARAIATSNKRKLTSEISGKIPGDKLIEYELGHLKSPAFFYEKR